MKQNKIKNWLKFGGLFLLALVIYFILIFVYSLFNLLFNYSPDDSCKQMQIFSCSLDFSLRMFFAPIYTIISYTKPESVRVDESLGTIVSLYMWGVSIFWYTVACIVGYCLFPMFDKKSFQKK